MPRTKCNTCSFAGDAYGPYNSKLVPGSPEERTPSVALVDALKTPPVRNTHGRSILDIWLERLPATEQNAVLGALRDEAWRHVDLQAALEAEGAPKVADTTFAAWRKRKATDA